MTKRSTQHIIEVLKEKITDLQKENNALSDQVEETILFNFISESFDSISNTKELIETLLAKMSILKGIPLSYCIELKPRSYNILGSYYASEPIVSQCLEPVLTKEIREKILTESLFKINCGQDGFKIIPGADEKFKPYEVIIIPFHNHSIEYGIFMFVNEENTKSLFEGDLSVFLQFVTIVSDQWERLGLIKKLKDLNISLEKRVKRRTSELLRINNLLFREIQINQATNIELNDEKEKFRLLFSRANDAIYLWELDRNGKMKSCLEANQAAIDMTGYSLEELQKMTPKDLMFNVDDRKEKALLKQLDRNKTHKFELVQRRKDGGRLYVEVNAHLFTLNNRKVVLSITRDISDRKKIEKDLIEAKEKAEETDRLKSSFLANMSHEIRTPMNAISGFAELLKEGDLELSEVKDFADIILNNSSHLLNLINDLVDFSKIEAGYIKPTIGPCDVTVLLRNLKKNIQSLLYNYRKEHIDTVFEIPDFLNNHPILTDEIKLRQILFNLLNNSVKFTRQGTVSLRVVLQSDDWLQFIISDTGIGIPQKYHEKIFERFVQVKDKKTFSIPGTGLGLAICQNLASMLNGRVELLKSSPQGTTFVCTIPYRLAKAK